MKSQGSSSTGLSCRRVPCNRAITAHRFKVKCTAMPGWSDRKRQVDSPWTLRGPGGCSAPPQARTTWASSRVPSHWTLRTKATTTIRCCCWSCCWRRAGPPPARASETHGEGHVHAKPTQALAPTEPVLPQSLASRRFPIEKTTQVYQRHHLREGLGWHSLALPADLSPHRRALRAGDPLCSCVRLSQTTCHLPSPGCPNKPRTSWSRKFWESRGGCRTGCTSETREWFVWSVPSLAVAARYVD